MQCDEVHPTCSRCLKAGRPCKYTYGKVFAFVDDSERAQTSLRGDRGSSTSNWETVSSSGSEATSSGPDSSTAGRSVKHSRGLNLKSSRQAKSGRGVFHTFAPARWEGNGAQTGHLHDLSQLAVQLYGATGSQYVPSPLVSPAASLLQRWINQNKALADGSDTPYILGDWMELIPRRIGQSGAIDTALDCYIKSANAYIDRSAENLAATDDANARALRRIRTAIVADDSEQNHDHVLIAIGLLHLVEVTSYEST